MLNDGNLAMINTFNNASTFNTSITTAVDNVNVFIIILYLSNPQLETCTPYPIHVCLLRTQPSLASWLSSAYYSPECLNSGLKSAEP